MASRFMAVLVKRSWVLVDRPLLLVAVFQVLVLERGMPIRLRRSSSIKRMVGLV